MITIPFKHLNFNTNAPNSGYWDQHFLSEILSSPPYIEILDDSACHHCIVIVPGRQNVDYVENINSYINEKFGKVLVIITGDEESIFPVNELNHLDMKIWLQTPKAGVSYPNVIKFFGVGTTPHTDLLSSTIPEKKLNWFYSGQANHQRRNDMINELKKRNDGYLNVSSGFSLGLEPAVYIENMYNAKVIPCPSGAFTPDTFRFYEALETGCIPIADEVSTLNRNSGYWQMLYGQDIPFPTFDDMLILNNKIDHCLTNYTKYANKIFAWWQLYKREFKQDLLNSLVPTTSTSGITVVIPTSPTTTNPDTSIIEETISTVRHHLSKSEIIITFDGVRPEQEDLRANYEEYTRKLLWLCNKSEGMLPIVFDEHMHQTGMLREALKYVNTNKILYVEHDTPLTPDCEINWDSVNAMIDNNDADLIKFSFESHILDIHRHLVLDKTPKSMYNDQYIRTIQWSQRPHVASTEFYKRILRDHFSDSAKSFIEDKMHGIVAEAYKHEQLQGWNKYKIWMYHPEGNNIKRSYHLDARGNSSKFDNTQIF